MTAPRDLLLLAGVLVTQDDQRRVLRDQALTISGGQIREILPLAEAPAHAEDATLDLRHCIVLPGLVNAHTHSPMTLLRGLGDDMPLMPWLERRIWPLEAALTRELVRLGSQIACCEMASFGVTCFQDMYLWQDVTAEVVEDFGLKAVLAEGVVDFPTRSYQSPEEAYARVANLMADYAGHPRIRFALAPHTVHTTSDAILQHTCMQAEAYDTPWIIHAAEDLAELQKTLQKYGRRPIPLLDSLGCLTPRSVIVHGVEILEPEMHRLAAAGTSVVHCPRSNAKLGSGFAPVTQLLANGVNVALGTDGAASSNSLNMFAEMSLASLFAKHREADAAALPARTVLDMATRHGAQALGWPELGRLEAGGPADLCAVSLRQARLTPCFDPVSHLVHACGGAGVVLTMADGAILYDHGRFPTIDHAGLTAAAREALAWALARLAELRA